MTIRSGRLAAVAACALAGMAGVAYAAPVAEPAPRFDIQWPAGWTQSQQDGFVIAEPPGVLHTQCAAGSRSEAGVAAMTQAGINGQLAEPLSDDDWRMFAGSDLVQPFFDKIVVPGPIASQRATTTTVTADLAIIKLRAAIFAVPGTVFVATCAAPSEAYDALAASFEATLATFALAP